MSCLGGHPDHCEVAAKKMRGSPLEASGPRYADVLQRGCDGGRASLCNKLAELLTASPAFSPDEARSKALSARACQLGDGLGCFVSAQPSFAPSGSQTGDAEAGLARARALLTQRCDANDGVGCGLLSAVVLVQEHDGERARTLQARSAAALESTCLAGALDDCVLAVAAIGAVAPNDSFRMKRVLDKGCGEGSPEACTMLARAWENAPPKEKEALYKKGCDGNRADACMILGKHFLDDSKDPSVQGSGKALILRGIALAKASCELADGEACPLLAGSLTLDAVPLDEAKKTAVLIEGLCDRHQAMTCNQLADSLANGPAGLFDEARIASLKKKACDYGYPFACVNPVAQLGLAARLPVEVWDRQTGLDWSRVSEQPGGVDAAKEFCKTLPNDGGGPYRLPNKKELEALAERVDVLRPYVVATAPAYGYLMSNDLVGGNADAPWIMNLRNGHVFNGTGYRGFARCVRKSKKKLGEVLPVLTLKMRGETFEYAILGAKRKVLAAASIVKVRQVKDWAPTLDGSEVKAAAGPVDVDVDPSVEWELAERFLMGAKRSGLAFARVAVDGKSSSAKK